MVDFLKIKWSISTGGSLPTFHWKPWALKFSVENFLHLKVKTPFFYLRLLKIEVMAVVLGW